MEDLNLDFLSATPPRPEQQHLVRLHTPIPKNQFSNVVSTKNKRLQMAEKIAKVDELVREIERFKVDNNELKRQLKDFQKTATDVQNLYSEEKQQHACVKKDLEQLRLKYDKIDSEFANKSMFIDQLSARLAEYEARPIEYNSLLVKFVKIVQMLSEEECLKYSQDKTLVEELKHYCLKMNLKITPKKGRSRAVKPKSVNASVQCSDLAVKSQKPAMQDQYTQCMAAARLEPTITINESHCSARPEMRNQYAQCQVALRNQGSQYISTMITRQTNTEKIVQKHVSTMFPEPKPAPPINDILNVFCKWADIRSITPLEDSPRSMKSNKVAQLSFTTTGTCTMLCNIRRKIDYLPSLAPGIKQELTTPSPSPIPTSNSSSGPSKRPQPSSNGHDNINNQNLLPNSILTLFNANSNSALGQLSTTAFNELWQIFGTMLLSLLQTSNAGIANISQNSINQQQFLDWLLELYMNSQSSTNTSTQTETNQVISTQTSPLRFDESSALSSPNIVRPQVKKSFATELCSSSENEIDLQSQLSEDINLPFIEQQNTMINTATPLIDDNYSQDSNSMDIEIQNIQATANVMELQTDNCKTKSRNGSKKSRKDKSNHKLLQEIQELLPEAKLNKKKRKALKRLLNKPKKNKQVEILSQDETDNTDNQHIETAVDFLKMFAQNKSEFQNLADTNGTSNYMENEMSTPNDAIDRDENFKSNQTEIFDYCSKPVTTSVNEEFTFIKPIVSQTQSHPHKGNFCNSTFIKPAGKPKKSCTINKRIENKYQILFGDSDNELEEEGDINKRPTNPVISQEEDFRNENPIEQNLENCQNSFDTLRDNCYNTELEKPTTQSLQMLADNSYTIKDNKFSLGQTTTFQQTKDNIFVDISSQEQFSIPEISTPLLADLINMSPFNNTMNPVFNKLEIETEMQPSITEAEETEAAETIEEFPCEIHKDLELSSDEELTAETENDLKPSKNDSSFTLESEFRKQYALPVLKDNTRKYRSKTNNSLDVENYHNKELSYNNKSSSLTAITNPSIEQDMYMKYSTNKLENNRTNVESNPSTEQDMDLKYSTNELENNRSVCSNVELTFKCNSSSESLAITKTYTSDFEKDFEMSSDNESVLTESDNQYKDDLKPNYAIESSPSKESLSESDEMNSPLKSQNMEQDFQGFDNDHQVYNQIMPVRGETIHYYNPTSEDRPLTTPKLTSLQALPDFKDTFSQKGHYTQAENIKKEQNLSFVKEKEDLERITTPNDMEPSISTTISTTCDDEEISIIEISSDVTGLDHEPELETDLIIDEDYDNDKTSEKSDINLYTSRTNSPANDETATNQNYELTDNEEHNYSKTKLNDCSKTENIRDTYTEDDLNTNETILNDGSKTEELRLTNTEDDLDTSNISTLLNSTLYNEVLTDSINPIVCDLLKEDVILQTSPQINKTKRGRKRKSECLAVEVVQPCKRSQRLKAKQMVLEQTIDISECSIEIGKYTANKRNSFKDFKPSNNVEDTKKKSLKDLATNNDNKIEVKQNMPIMKMGFFLERLEPAEEEEKPKKVSTLNKEHKLEPKPKQNDNLKNDIEIQDLPSSKETPKETKATVILKVNNKTLLSEAWFYYTESPKSPTPSQSNDDQMNSTYTVTNIPLDRPLQYLPQQKNASLFDTLMNSYSTESQRSIQPINPTKVFQRQQQILYPLQMDIEMYGNSEMQLDPDLTANQLINKLLKKTQDYELIKKAILNVAQIAESSQVPEKEFPSIIQELPPRHLSGCLQRLFVLLKQFLNRNSNFCQDLILKIEKLLFTTQQLEDKLSLQATLNLTQLYLSACKHQESIIPNYKHPGRLFIAKCLYYNNKKAVLMIHEMLLWCPTVLPYREDKTYDRSDALITVIQEILMNTKYEMDNPHLRGKLLISKLRFEYHFVPFSPSLDEVINNLVDKLKNTKFYNISMAFGLLCKRLPPEKVQEKLLNSQLLPLANEYYNKALLTCEYDKRIAVLLEIISMIVKPFPVETNVEVYLHEFSRFLNGFDRPVIQEAALCSIIRLQRFGCVNCFNYLHHFKPTFELDSHTQAMLRTFLYRKPLTFWKTIKLQNPRNHL